MKSAQLEKQLPQYVLNRYTGPDTPLPERQCIKRLSQHCITPVISDYLSVAWDGIFNDTHATIWTTYEQNTCLGVAASILSTQQTRLKGTPYFDMLTNYFVMGIIDPHARHTGLYAQFNAARLEQAVKSNSDLLFVRTQNPHVFLGITSMLRRFVTLGMLKNFTFEYAHVEQGTYGTLLTEDAPDLTLPGIPDIMRTLNTSAGDVMLYMWRMVK